MGGDGKKLYRYPQQNQIDLIHLIIRMELKELELKNGLPLLFNRTNMDTKPRRNVGLFYLIQLIYLSRINQKSIDMKKLFLLLPFLLLIGCSAPQKPPTTTHPEKQPSFMLNGKIKCEIYNETQFFSRIVTFDFVTEKDLKIIADTLKPKNKIIYFNIPELLGKGEEYAALVDGFPAVYKDFSKEKMLAKRSDNEKKEAEYSRSVGVEDKEFANNAFVISKEFVKQKLLSPKSADFPFMDFKFSNVIDNTIVIESYVDAKNSYGTEIRHNYTIKMKKIGSDWADSNSWQVISLDFN